MIRLKQWWRVLKKAFEEFSDDNAMKLSASLSYYTLFSLGPMLVIIISFAGIFFGKDAVEGEIYNQIKDLVGSGAARQVQSIIANAQQHGDGVTGAIIGIGLLLLGATGVFNEIQSSINYMWSVKAKPEKGWLKILLNRLISFSLVISCGFILLVSLALTALLEILGDKLREFFPEATVVVFFILNYVLVLLVTSTLFAIIFKVLPDAKIRWKDVMIGSIFTALLFMVGRVLIGFYLGRSHIGLAYGAAASLILLLTWVYYSSIILYFGAEFTKVYALYHGGGIMPRKTAVMIVKQEVKEVEPEDLL